jgi:hypothetical protein
MFDKIQREKVMSLACEGLSDDEVKVLVDEIARLKAYSKPVAALVEAQIQGQAKGIEEMGRRIIDLEDALREMVFRYKMYLDRFGEGIEASHPDSFKLHRDVLYE